MLFTYIRIPISGLISGYPNTSQVWIGIKTRIRIEIGKYYIRPILASSNLVIFVSLSLYCPLYLDTETVEAESVAAGRFNRPTGDGAGGDGALRRAAAAAGTPLPPAVLRRGAVVPHGSALASRRRPPRRRRKRAPSFPRQLHRRHPRSTRATPIPLPLSSPRFEP